MEDRMLKETVDMDDIMLDVMLKGRVMWKTELFMERVTWKTECLRKE